MTYEPASKTSVPVAVRPSNVPSRPPRKKEHPKRPLMMLAMLGTVLALGLAAKGRGVKTWLLSPFRPARDHAAGHVGGPSGVILPADPSIRFQRVELPDTKGVGYTCVAVGPDRKLYASADDGRLFRFPILDDGTLGPKQVINSLRDTHDGSRLVSGFCFDPASTAERPVVWVSHGFHGLFNAPDFSGILSRMSGPDLETVEDVVIHLPRSVRDHLNNQPSFGPDGALYFPQGCNTAMGGPDAEWGYRPEHLLNATILRLDTTKLSSGLPLDVQTPDAGGAYDPAKPGAPLTIFATGLRNAFDLVWTSGGHLYVPVNGSSCGGNTPTGPDVMPLLNVKQTEPDWLFEVSAGKYYGHPNPQQGHYVLNGGHPDAKAAGNAVITAYPVGTRPDKDWQPAAFDLGEHVSANGIIEYRGPAFDGRLDKKLLVCRYNVGADIIVITLDNAVDVAKVEAGAAGLAKFQNPLDLTEDFQTGNLYVADYGARHLVLLKAD